MRPRCINEESFFVLVKNTMLWRPVLYFAHSGSIFDMLGRTFGRQEYIYSVGCEGSALFQSGQVIENHSSVRAIDCLGKAEAHPLQRCQLF
jgi:hypothetical protein